MASKEEVSKLFITVLNRVLDVNTMDYWLQKSDYNAQFIDAFLTEKAEKQNELSTKDFVELVYKNALDKSPTDDPEGMQWWTDSITNNNWSKAEFLVRFFDTIELYKNGTIPSTTEETHAVSFFEVKHSLAKHASETIKHDVSNTDTLTFGVGLTNMTVNSIGTSINKIQSEIDKIAASHSIDSNGTQHSSSETTAASDNSNLYPSYDSQTDNATTTPDENNPIGLTGVNTTPVDTIIA